MSDLLIVGKAPKSEVGKEFFLYHLDWWHEILHVLRKFGDKIYFDDFFIEECWLCPETPLLDESESKLLSGLLVKDVDNANIGYLLEKFYREDSLMIDYFDGDEDQLQAAYKERMGQFEEFVSFLSSCGGCRVKWHGMKDD